MSNLRLDSTFNLITANRNSSISPPFRNLKKEEGEFCSFKPKPFYKGLKSTKSYCPLTVWMCRYQTASVRFGGETILSCLLEFGRRSSDVSL